MKRLGIVTLLMLILLTFANADVYVRKTLVDDKWYIKEIPCKDYNWLRKNGFIEEYEDFTQTSYTTKDGTEVMIFGECHTEVNPDLWNNNPNLKGGKVQRAEIIRYYTKRRL